MQNIGSYIEQNTYIQYNNKTCTYKTTPVGAMYVLKSKNQQMWKGQSKIKNDLSRTTPNNTNKLYNCIMCKYILN